MPGDGRAGLIDLLVVGAGPTGLTAALEARRLGLSVRLIDRRPGRVQRSKALILHARTLEVFDTLGVASQILRRGAPLHALNLHGAWGARGRLDIDRLAWGDTEYPFWLSLPQYETEQVLEAALTGLGVTVEWGVACTALRQTAARVDSTLTGAGRPVCASRWVLGADGGRSTVRQAIGAHLDRVEAHATFLLADVRSTAALPAGEGQVFLHPEGLLIIAPLPRPGTWRIVAHLPGATPAAGPALDGPLLDRLVRRRAGIELGAHEIGWTSRFGLSHGIADRMRRGRVFLAGDAAHIHSPVGGQGLNAGVHDVHNLLWKIALATRIRRAAGPAAAETCEALLESYAAERRPVTAAMVAAVERASSALTGRSAARRRLLGAIAPRVITHTPARAVAGRTMAGLNSRYRTGPLVLPGDRSSGRRACNLVGTDGRRALAGRRAGRWMWVVAGDDAPAAYAGLPVRAAHPASGTPAVQLVRPDGHLLAAGAGLDAVHRSVTRHAVARFVLDHAAREQEPV